MSERKFFYAEKRTRAKDRRGKRLILCYISDGKKREVSGAGRLSSRKGRKKSHYIKKMEREKEKEGLFSFLAEVRKKHLRMEEGKKGALRSSSRIQWGRKRGKERGASFSWKDPPVGKFVPSILHWEKGRKKGLLCA